ncbi:MAG: hypothetical protein HRU15_05950 [Planctomycetes bacterium]|nr:hypothetical protein [Planctomycetota bacterium]
MKIRAVFLPKLLMLTGIIFAPDGGLTAADAVVTNTEQDVVKDKDIDIDNGKELRSSADWFEHVHEILSLMEKSRASNTSIELMRLLIRDGDVALGQSVFEKFYTGVEEERGAYVAEIAGAYALTNELFKAMQCVKKITIEDDKARALAHVLSSQAKLGHVEYAVKHLENVSSEFYKSMVYKDVALAFANKSDPVSTQSAFMQIKDKTWQVQAEAELRSYVVEKRYFEMFPREMRAAIKAASYSRADRQQDAYKKIYSVLSNGESTSENQLRDIVNRSKESWVISTRVLVALALAKANYSQIAQGMLHDLQEEHRDLIIAQKLSAPCLYVMMQLDLYDQLQDFDASCTCRNIL